MLNLLRSLALPLPGLPIGEIAIDFKHHTRVAYASITMDLLRSLIVPPAIPGTPTSALSQDQQHSRGPAVTSSQASTSNLPLISPTQPTTLSPAQNESADVPTKKQKKRQKQKQKQKATKPEQSKKTVAPLILSSSAGITKSSKRKRSHFFHPDRPRASANRRTAISYEDLYDDVPAQQPSRSSNPELPNQSTSTSSSEATQTCFFWYHGTCKRSQDRQGCQLRHALQNPPSMVVAPPRFVHFRPCGLEWCAGDGPRKGQRAKTQAMGEQKRYFEIAVSDGSPAHETGSETAAEEDECFLGGFEETTA
jgi:outer membrane biosynthesis protein TonB